MKTIRFRVLALLVFACLGAAKAAGLVETANLANLAGVDHLGRRLVGAANRVAYTVSAAALGIDTARPFRLEFKWSDNRQTDDVMDFYVNGDAAPRGRLNWLFIYDPD